MSFGTYSVDTETPQKNTRLTFSSASLKLIAYITMLIDHLAAVLIENNSSDWPNRDMWIKADFVMRSTGRLAFIIFCFLLVEGFKHTRSLIKYVIRLAAFAVISEIPFNLAVNETWLYADYQNVYWTLLLGFIMMIILNRLQDKPLILRLLIIAVLSVIACLIKCDYSCMGIILIATFYHYDLTDRNTKLWPIILIAYLSYIPSVTVTCLQMGYTFSGELMIAAAQNGLFEMIGLLSLLLIKRYNGSKGKLMPKPVYYLFYPVHLLILGLISTYVL